MNNMDDFKNKAEKSIEHLNSDLLNIRTGRATPMLVENINVSCYGAMTPLVQLATISSSDSSSLIIQPWDKSVMKEIEKAIQASDLGINPVNEGKHIRITIPPLNEEKRLELIKIMKKKAELERVAIRNIRENVLKEKKKEEKEKTISEDEFFTFQKELQKAVDEYMDRIKIIIEKKEKEIMTV